MAIPLIVAVLDLAVPLTPAERLLLVCLAERADVETGECYPSEEELMRRTGMSARGLGDTFSRLACRGLEVRVPIRPGATGRGAYAAKGHRRTYRLPSAVMAMVTSRRDLSERKGHVQTSSKVTPERDPNRQVNRHPQDYRASQRGSPSGKQASERTGRKKTLPELVSLRWPRQRMADYYGVDLETLAEEMASAGFGPEGSTA